MSLLFCTQHTSAATTPPAAALLAEQFYQKGDYTAALIHFQQAQHIDNSLAIRYNIASCYVQLRDWRKAQQVFAALDRDYPGLDLVQYHLAVAEKNLGQTASAATRFQTLVVAAQSQQIAAIAQQQLDALGAKPNSASKTSESPWAWQGQLGMALGREDYQPDDETLSGQAAFASTLSASGDLGYQWRHPAGAPRPSGWQVMSRALLERYVNHEYTSLGVDIQALQAQLQYQWPNSLYGRVNVERRWQHFAEGLLVVPSLGLAVGQTALSSRRAGHRWQLSAEAFEYTSRSASLQPLAGKRELATLSYDWLPHWPPGRLQHALSLALHYEQNQRENDASRSQFISYSPNRTGVNLAWRVDRAGWYGQLGAAYRTSFYAGPSQRVDRHRFPERKDLRTSANLLVAWQRGAWEYRALVEHRSNQSSQEHYRYQDIYVSLGADWRW
jgi:tetratricopeptide (TPR) repeat protein